MAWWINDLSSRIPGRLDFCDHPVPFSGFLASEFLVFSGMIRRLGVGDQFLKSSGVADGIPDRIEAKQSWSHQETGALGFE
jgi:hypothetical protein